MSYTFKSTLGHGTINPFVPRNAGSDGIQHTKEWEEAIVIDVIINNSHPEYSMDGYNVGAIKFRFLNSNFFRPEFSLHWAFPMDANFSEYPLINEIVQIHENLNRFYYTKKLNMSNLPTTHVVDGIEEETSDINTVAFPSKIRDSSAVGPFQPPQTNSGIGASASDNVHRLKHFEGDIIVEGRFGNSIRFGSSVLSGKSGVSARAIISPWQSLRGDNSPNILFRIGEDSRAELTVPNSRFAQVLEDINTDKTSLWMVSDQIVPIRLSTVDSNIHGVSIEDFPRVFSGNQLIINSDRIIINSKTDKFLLHTARGIHLTTLDDVTIDSDRNHTTWTTADRSDRVGGTWRSTINGDNNSSAGRDFIAVAGRNHFVHAQNVLNLNAGVITLGGASDTSESMVLGMTLRDFLQQLITILVQDPIVLVTNRPGSPSTQNPQRKAALTRLASQFLSGGPNAAILSLDNFVSRNNPRPFGARSLDFG